MTLGTLHVLVLAAKMKARLVVVEAIEIDGRPTRFTVAVLAVRKTSVVWVLVGMARRARGAESQERAPSIVALAALLPPVRAAERPATEIVVKSILVAAGPTDLRHAATEMFNVTGRAVTSAVLAAVETRASADASAKFRVAG